MIVVLDASAAVKLVLDENRSDQVRRLWDERLTMTAPSVVAAEVAAAIRAASRDGRITEPAARLAQQSWASLIEDIDMLAFDQTLADRARGLAATRTVRGMDAIYLAVAVRLAEVNSTGLLSFDVRQRGALTPEDGVHLLPAEAA
ncbi:MAG: PIN domain-containing protein [Streptosporangiaceae bacterium]